MNKTIHKDLTKNTLKMYLTSGEERHIYVTKSEHAINEYLKHAAKDLLQPRAVAIAEILKKAKEQQ